MAKTFDPKSELGELKAMLYFIAEKTLATDQFAEFKERFPLEAKKEPAKGLDIDQISMMV